MMKKQDNRQRLFEVMQRLDKTFKPKINEEFTGGGRDEYLAQQDADLETDFFTKKINNPENNTTDDNDKTAFNELNTIGRDLRKPQIQRLVNEINKLIASAIDNDGDPIGVIDSTSTWQEPYTYESIVYNKMGQLVIKSKSQYNNKIETDVINAKDMEFDGIPTLREIAKQYRRALKKSGVNINEEVVDSKENLEYFLSFNNDDVYWKWINGEIDDNGAIEIMRDAEGMSYDPNVNYKEKYSN